MQQINKSLFWYLIFFLCLLSTESRAIPQEFLSLPTSYQPASNTYSKDIYSFERIGVLLPLSGKNQDLGKQILKAIQLAYFKTRSPLKIKVYDTQSTPQGLDKALTQLRKDDIRIVIGPIFKESVRIAQEFSFVFPPLFFTFSNEMLLANSHTYMLGLTPHQQIQALKPRLQKSPQRTHIFLPKTPLGNTFAQEILALEFIPPEQIHFLEKDFSFQDVLFAQQADDSLPLTIALLGWGLESIPVAAHLKSAHPKARLVFVGDYGFTHPQIQSDPVLKKARHIHFNKTLSKKFQTLYHSFYKANPHILALYGYDILSILSAAKQKMEKDGITLQEALSSTQFKTTSGIVSFDVITGQIGRDL